MTKTEEIKKTLIEAFALVLLFVVPRIVVVEYVLRSNTPTFIKIAVTLYLLSSLMETVVESIEYGNNRPNDFKKSTV